MFITKKHLSRRTFLFGAGATIALPMLDAMVPALTAQTICSRFRTFQPVRSRSRALVNSFGLR